MSEEEIKTYIENYITEERDIEKEQMKEKVTKEIGIAKENKDPLSFAFWSEIEERIERIEYEFF